MRQSHSRRDHPRPNGSNPAIAARFRWSMPTAGRCFRIGDVDRPVFPRSAVKALQALPLVESGIAEQFGLTDEEIALACASHSGEPAHVAVAAAMLAKAGATQPASNAARIGRSARRPAGRSPRRARSRRPCTTTAPASMRASSASPAASDADPTGYVGAGAPGAAAWSRAALEDLTGASHADETRGIDGCSIPTYAIPLPALAFGFARFGTGPGISARRRAAAAQRIRKAVASTSVHGRRHRPLRHAGDGGPRRARLHQDRRRGRLLRGPAGARLRHRLEGG